MIGPGVGTHARPRTVGALAVQADLGATQIGPVLLAVDPATDSRVLIQVIHLQSRRRVPPASILDALRGLCSSDFEHKGVARPLTCGIEDVGAYVVYAYAGGTSIDVLIRDHGPVALSDVVHRLSPVATAIDNASAVWIHHGALTARDIFINPDGVTVTGFGIVQALQFTGARPAVAAPYASPQRLGGALPTVGDDVYSLGVVALEMIVGHAIDVGDAVSADTLRSVLGGQPPRSSEDVLGVVSHLENIRLRTALGRALSPDVSARPTRAAELVARLQHAVHDAPRPAAPSQMDSSAGMEFVSEEAPPPRRRSRSAPASPVAPVATVAPPAAPRATPRPAPQVLLREFVPIERDRGWIREELSSGPLRNILATLLLLAGGGLAAWLLWAPPPTPRAAQPAAVEQQATGAESFTSPDPPEIAPESAATPPIPPADPPVPPAASVDPPRAVATPTATSSDPPPGASPAPTATERRERAASPPQAAGGRIVVVSRPPGASVTVDGAERGTTPLTITGVEIGSRRVQLSHPGFDTLQRTVTLTARRPATSVRVELRPTGGEQAPSAADAPPGSLHVVSRPAGAQLFIDDMLVGTTPLLVSGVAPGPHRIRLELAGYQPWSSSVEIEPKARFRVDQNLEQ